MLLFTTISKGIPLTILKSLHSDSGGIEVGLDVDFDLGQFLTREHYLQLKLFHFRIMYKLDGYCYHKTH